MVLCHVIQGAELGKGNETWVNSANSETARKCLKDLVRLPNIGPVTAVKIYKLRETYGLFKNVKDIKKVEVIGPAIFAGSKFYINEPKAH